MKLSNKLFLMLIMIIFLNIILLPVIGITFMFRFYMNNKIDELTNSADTIYSLYSDGQTQELQTYMKSLEENNIDVLITDADLTEIQYYSRPITDQIQILAFYRSQLQTALNFDFQQLHPTISFFKGIGDNETPLIATKTLNSNTILLLETPKTYLATTSKLAIQFTMYACLSIIAGSCIFLFFVSKKITRPIIQIQNTADKIANMDFSKKCVVRTKDEVGKLASSINNMSDKLKENMEQLILANEVLTKDLQRAEETEKMRKQFIANVSHDFKTPLTLILNYAENIKTEQTKEQVKIITDEANKMSNLVNQLLKLSQLESGMLELDNTFFSIDELISSIINKHKIVTQSNDLTVHFASSGYIVQGDYHKIEQVFTNIFENAIKHTPEGKSITVTLEKTDPVCRICIHNEGKPIGAQDLNNLFISFYKSDQSRMIDKSYGLGLAIVKVIMEMHGNKYGVSNTADGVLFWFELNMMDL